MQIAQVQYTGPMRTKITRAPSGRQYHFQHITGGNEEAGMASISDAADARYFEKKEVYDVKYTGPGQLISAVDEPLNSVEAMLGDMAYRQKQRLVSSLGLDVAGNASEEEFDQALEPAIKDLQRSMEDN